MADCVAVAVKILEGLDILKVLESLFTFKERHHPDKDIISDIDKLCVKFDQIRDDIKRLEKMINWETTILQYVEAISRIKLGMQYCRGIGKGIEQAEKDNQERLKEVCANQSFSLALGALLDGMAGTGEFQKSILDEFYIQTKGHRPKILALATQLQELICGGMVVLATYETVVRGEEGAKAMARLYGSRLKEVDAKVKSVLDTCVEKFKENMLNDLKEALDAAGTDNYLVIELSKLMRDKYDWLENFCLVYKQFTGTWNQHCFDGDRIECPNRNEKGAVVFYRAKSEPPMLSHRYNEVYGIIDEVCCGKPDDDNRNIVAKLKAKDIEWTGCAVVRRSSYPKFYGTFSSKIICIDKSYKMPYKNATSIILLK